jgi:hypothetical protein
MEVPRRVLVWAFVVGVATGLASGQQAPSPPRPRAYGTATDSAYHLGASDFLPRNSIEDVYAEVGSGNFARYTTLCSGPCLVAVPHLPDGALLTGIIGYFCDSNATYDAALHVARSQPDGTNITFLAFVKSTGTPSGCGVSNFQDLTSLNFQVNYQNNQLLVFADNVLNDGTLAIAGATIFYRLQVSPAPATPTFGDVPVTDPGFQFIEALGASGITVGCGGGNYCPDAPLTRRQMAVLLAKALGLQWP